MVMMAGCDEIVIVAAVRTPLTRSQKGALAHVPPSTLVQTVLEGLLNRMTKIHKDEIEDVCFGNVLMPANGFAATRMAIMAAGLPPSTSLHMVNRQCASGLQAVAQIAAAIRCGEIKVGIAGGVESMSRFPMKSIQPPPVDWDVMQQHKLAMDCLLPMGITSENICQEYGLERHVLDEFAVQSHRKAARAQQEGKFDAEIVETCGVLKDDGIRPSTDLATLGKLKSAFTRQGLTTAGNASQTTDGAAAVLLMTRREAERRGLAILAVWKGFATAGVPPHIMGIGPVYAIPKVLQQVSLSKDDIDVIELNEAFASQSVYCVDKLGLDKHKVNPNGGAIALGHPLGCTGTRLLVSCIYELQRQKQRYGLISMCIGTGMGAAAVIEVETKSSL